ncbi:MAG: biotin transporter BioY [Thermodesulfovibrionales bacterium]|nr:biotin transporter BioY [Thermodesulfovibrionales bacterium]
MSFGFRSDVVSVSLPDGITKTVWQNILLSFLGSIFIALSAQISVPLPFTPVPLTCQTFAVLLTGILLGAKRGLMSVLFYLSEGAMGMPVFAGAMGGFHVLLGPSGGYLVGFLPAVFLIGYLHEKGWTKGFFPLLVALIVSNSLIYVFGVMHLLTYTNIENVLYVGVYPFLIGDLLKVVLISVSVRVMSLLRASNIAV